MSQCIALLQKMRRELLVLQDAQTPSRHALQTLLSEIELSEVPGQSLEALNQRLSEERAGWD